MILFTRYCTALLLLLNSVSFAQKKMNVFGYFAGRSTMIDSFPVEKLTHLCFSFTHLKGNQISLSNRNDSASLRNCVAQKKRNPTLKVIVSMGGWTGCYSCSPVFASDAGRKEFAGSVKKLLRDFNADGIDLDWEYPVVKGPPGHPYSPEDKEHFTALIRDLRDSLGSQKEISFAAGGFTEYIEKSVDWDAVTPLVDRINLMTYDLITGYDTITGHHTALYKTKAQRESCENAVDLLLKKGVPANKLLIGAAFYARIWKNVSSENDGLRGKGVFFRGVSFRSYDPFFSADSGFVYHWDKKTAAPWLYHPQRQWFVTYDDERSLLEKMKFVRRKKLDGIMFWQLADDAFSNGLLDVIDRDRKAHL